HGFFVLDIVAVNPVTWSLSYEVAFYLAVPLLALAWGARAPAGRERLATWLLAGVFVAVIVAAAASRFGTMIYSAYFALVVPGLWLGLMDSEARERAAQRLPAPLALGAWIAFALSYKLGVFSNRDPAYYVLSAIACGLLVLKTCDAASFPG